MRPEVNLMNSMPHSSPHSHDPTKNTESFNCGNFTFPSNLHMYKIAERNYTKMIVEITVALLQAKPQQKNKINHE
jgi:hypothetical protein